MDTSQLRRQLAEASRLFDRQLRTIMEHDGLVRGGIYRLRRKCGKTGCRCTQGQLHETWVHMVREDGVQRIRVLPKGEVARWRALGDEYRRFRLARRELTRQYARILQLVDQLEGMRAVTPPARRKGNEDAPSGCVRGEPGLRHREVP